ncbi:hypothetical protein [Bacillus sp. NEAU-Y102]
MKGKAVTYTFVAVFHVVLFCCMGYLYAHEVLYQEGTEYVAVTGVAATGFALSIWDVLLIFEVKKDRKDKRYIRRCMEQEMYRKAG